MTTEHPHVVQENARLTETNEEPASQSIWHTSWKQNRDLPTQLRPDNNSHRQMVVPDTEATMPLLDCLAGQIWAVSAGQRRPVAAGSSQARALTATTTSRESPRDVLRVVGHSGLPAAGQRTACATWRPPGAGCPSERRSRRCPALGGVQDSPGADHIPVRCRIRARRLPGGGARPRSGRCGTGSHAASGRGWRWRWLA